MAEAIPMATREQVCEARRIHGERVAACKRLGVDPPNFYTILTEIVNSPKGSLDLPKLTPAERRQGAVFQSYTQYQAPKKLTERE